MPTIAFTMSLSSGDDGKLHAEISPSDEEEHFSVSRALFVLRMWRESIGIVRCSVHHPASGMTAYVQGNGTLAELVRILHLELRR